MYTFTHESCVQKLQKAEERQTGSTKIIYGKLNDSDTVRKPMLKSTKFHIYLYTFQ